MCGQRPDRTLSPATLLLMEQASAPTVAAGREGSRQDATPLDTDFVLTIEQVADLYAKAGHPARSAACSATARRAISTASGRRRHSAARSTSCRRSRSPVTSHRSRNYPLATWSRLVATRRVLVATTVVAQQSQDDAPASTTGPDDTQRHTATSSDTSRYVERLERKSSRRKTSAIFCASRSTAKTRPSKR